MNVKINDGVEGVVDGHVNEILHPGQRFRRIDSWIAGTKDKLVIFLHERFQARAKLDVI